jgi:hypothetical protein
MRIKVKAARIYDNRNMPATTMLLADLSPSPPEHRTVSPAPVASVFLPKEHGSWSLALEPLCLGLLIAPSWAGTALGIAALAVFFARRPLKTALTADSSDRRQRAFPALALLVVLASAALLEAGCLGGPAALWPLLLAAPLGGLFVYFDLQNEARAAAAEGVGSSAFALVPAAIATLAGWPVPVALALGAIALARNLPTVLTVRAYVRQAKGQTSRAGVPLLAAGLAGGALLRLHALSLVPVICVIGPAFHFALTAWLLSPLRPAWPARRIGLLARINHTGGENRARFLLKLLV